MRAETAEREVQKLQKEVDLMEVSNRLPNMSDVCTNIISHQADLLGEKNKQKRMDEDMESLLQSINSI